MIHAHSVLLSGLISTVSYPCWSNLRKPEHIWILQTVNTTTKLRLFDSILYGTGIGQSFMFDVEIDSRVKSGQRKMRHRNSSKSTVNLLTHINQPPLVYYSTINRLTSPPQQIIIAHNAAAAWYDDDDIDTYLSKF